MPSRRCSSSRPLCPRCRSSARGKVRDLYDLGDALLIVATDRISAFDYVLGSGIPDKGRVLTQMSAFWFDRRADIVAEPPADADVDAISRGGAADAEVLARPLDARRKTEPLPIECVARGYLSGSGWKDYQARGAVCGIRLPAGLPSRTPARADLHAGDQGRSGPRPQHHRSRGRARWSARRCSRDCARLTLELYSRGVGARRGARHHPRRHQVRIRLADGGELLLIDEVLTPDSSRFWPRDQYRAGRSAAELRQAVRPRLSRAIRWNKQPPVPSLPDDVVARTRESTRSVSATDRARLEAPMRDRLEQLVGEMVDKGIRYQDAPTRVREAFHRPVVGRCDGNLSATADDAGHASKHADAEDG